MPLGAWRCQLRTFGLSEVTILDTSLELTVKLGVEDGLRGGVDTVVGLDVFLDGLAAVRESRLASRSKLREDVPPRIAVYDAWRQDDPDTDLLPLRSLSCR